MYEADDESESDDMLCGGSDEQSAALLPIYGHDLEL